MADNEKTSDIKAVRWSAFAAIILLAIFIVWNNKSFSQSLGVVQKVFLCYFEGYYIVFSMLFVALSVVLAVSPIGKIRLGRRKRPRFGLIKWGMMVFTATMAADIIFFSLHEWIYYADNLSDTYFRGDNIYISSLAYSFFHWGITPWSFYLLPAVMYGYIMFNRQKECYKLSHACQPLITNRYLLLFFDAICVFSLVCVVSTTFSLATPLIAASVKQIFHFGTQMQFTLCTIVLVGVLCCCDNLLGIEIGTANIAKVNYLLFVLLLFLFLLFGKSVFILHLSLQALLQYLTNFIGLSAFMSKGAFTVSYTVFYWAYWIAWSIATPFFIALISEGMRIRRVIVFGYFFGVLSTFVSFGILGGSIIARTKVVPGMQFFSPEKFIIGNIMTYPHSTLILVLLITTMVFMYITTLNSVIIIASQYTAAKISWRDKVFWSILFIILPILLVQAKATTMALKIIAVLSSLPVSVLLLLIIMNFIKILKDDYCGKK